MEKGDKVKFTDKTGEALEGEITKLNFMGDENVIGVLCFKKSWDMKVSCIVPRELVTLLPKKEHIDEALNLFNGYWANDYTVCDEVAKKHGYNKDIFSKAVYKQAKF